MKTIRKIAEEIGVSKQAIYSKINKPPLSKSLQDYVSKKNGVLTISLHGENLIKQAFSSTKRQAKLSTVDTSFDNELTILLHSTIAILRVQLDEKDKQIAELTAIIKTHTKQTNKPTKAKPSKKITHSPRKLKSAPIERLMGK